MRRGFRRAATAAGVWAIAAAITLIGGAVRGSASTSGPSCTPLDSSRQFCVTVTDSDGVIVSGQSISGTNEKTLSYIAYTITVENNATSGSLTNGTTTIKLKDNGSVSTAAFQSSLSPGFCRLTSSKDNIVTCTHGNLAADTDLTFTVVYVSSTTVGTTATTADIVTAFKEMLKKGTGANEAQVTAQASTTYNSGDDAGSWSPSGNNPVRLATDSTDTTWSVLKFSNLLQPGFVAALHETDVGANVNCEASLKACTGQNVEVDLNCATACAVSDENFAFIQIKITDPDPGVNENTAVVSHLLEDGTTFERIDTVCPSNPPTDAEDVPCIGSRTMTNLGGGHKLLTIGVWIDQNGNVRVGA